MIIDTVRKLVRREPFRPFVIHLTDGQEVSVASRDSIACSPQGHSVVVAQPDDRLTIIDVSRISEVQAFPD